MAGQLPTEPTDIALIEQLGVGRIAEALGISQAAVRKWRKTGVPENRRAAILALSQAESGDGEPSSAMQIGTSASDDQDDDHHPASMTETESLEDVGEAPAVDDDTEQDVRAPSPASSRAKSATPSARRLQGLDEPEAGYAGMAEPAAHTGRRRQARTASDSAVPKSRAQRQSAPAANTPSPTTVQTRKPVRLNRQTAIIVGSGLVAAIAIGLTQGLRQVSGSPTVAGEATEQAPIYQDQASAILPDFDYRILTQPAALTVVKEPSKTPEAPPEPEAPVAEPIQTMAATPAPVRDRHAEEEEAALQSGLFPPGAPTSSTAAPGSASPNPQGQDSTLAALDRLRQNLPTPQDLSPEVQRSATDQRSPFLNAELDQSIYLKNGLQKPLSDYEVKTGTVIPAALITGLNSDLPGEIIGQVTEHIYDTASGQHLLIPQGAKIFGRHNADVGYGQERAQIVWDRLIMPNGNSVQLEAMVGTDKAGYAGLADEVDHHLGRLIGAVILSSFISVGANLATDSGDDVTDALGDAAAQQAAQVGGQIVDRQLDIQPTITVRPGFKLNILVNKDMILEPYPAG